MSAAGIRLRAAAGALALLLAGFSGSALEATSCYSDLGIVKDVDPIHLAGRAQEVARRLEELGEPLDRWEMETLEVAFKAPRDPTSVSAIQQILDAHCLISLSLSAEGEIKAEPGPAKPYLLAGGGAAFLIKLDNLGRHGTRLLIESPDAIAADAGSRLGGWLRLEIWPEGAPASGERVDYFIMTVSTEERGRREGLFSFFTPLRPRQEAGPLSYNRTSILFWSMGEAELNRARLAHLLRHEHGRTYLAAPKRRGPPLAFIREATCLGCHDLGQESTSAPERVGREKDCLVCHRELASEDAGGRCSVCGMKNCRMGCIARSRTQAGESVMLMAGIPRWLFLGSVGGILVISFIAVEVLNRGSRRRREPRRWNLFAIRPLAWCFRQRWFKTSLQLPVFILFCFLIVSGFAGDQAVNITPVMTWTIWWAGLIFLVLFLGKAWCFICPWDFAATLVQSLGRLWGSRRPFTLGLRWPRGLRNITLAIGLFILLTWLELGYRVTASPKATAVLALGMVGLAVIPAVLFDRRSFCRYGCFVGRISGLYALFSPIEIRRADPTLCRSCGTRECYHGDASTPACPTSLFLPAVRENTYCILCGYCVRSCPSGNVALNLRPFAADLTGYSRPRADEAILAVILLALTSFHGLTMTPLWESADGPSVIGWIRGALGVGPLGAFTAGMAAMLAAPILLYALICLASSWSARGAAVPVRKLFIYFAYSLLPVALFYHLAHNGMHFFMEGQYLLPLLSDPMGNGGDLFGTAAMRPGPILSAQALWGLQVGLVLVGHIFGIWIAHRAARELYSEPRRAALSLLPMLAGMVLYSWFSLWILHLDMNMRGTLI